MRISPFRVPKRRVDCFCEDPTCTWSHHTSERVEPGTKRWKRGNESNKQAINHTRKTGHLVKVITTTWYRRLDPEN